MVRSAALRWVSWGGALLLVACSGAESDGAGTATSSGGATSSTGASSGTGADAGVGGAAGTGATAGSGEEATGGTGSPGTGGDATGGRASGGGNGASFTCPEVTPGATPTLRAAIRIASAPSLDPPSPDLLDGPVWLNGALHLSQIIMDEERPPARVLKLQGADFEEVLADSGSNGLAVDGAGRLVAASHGLPGIVAFDLSAPTAAPTVIAEQYEGVGFNSPNDLTIRGDGNIYFTDPATRCLRSCPQGTDPGQQRVYRVAPDGAVTTVASAHEEPKAIALSPDGNTLYVGGSRQALEKFPVNPDGSVGTREVFASVSGVNGLAIDCAGNVYAALHMQRTVEVIRPDGSTHGSITLVQGPTNAAFGGPENKTLYMTTSGAALYSVALDIPGYPY